MLRAASASPLLVPTCLLLFLTVLCEVDAYFPSLTSIPVLKAARFSTHDGQGYEIRSNILTIFGMDDDAFWSYEVTEKGKTARKVALDDRCLPYPHPGSNKFLMSVLLPRMKELYPTPVRPKSKGLIGSEHFGGAKGADVDFHKNHQVVSRFPDGGVAKFIYTPGMSEPIHDEYPLHGHIPLVEYRDAGGNVVRCLNDGARVIDISSQGKMLHFGRRGAILKMDALAAMSVGLFTSDNVAITGAVEVKINTEKVEPTFAGLASIFNACKYLQVVYNCDDQVGSSHSWEGLPPQCDRLTVAVYDWEDQDQTLFFFEGDQVVRVFDLPFPSSWSSDDPSESTSRAMKGWKRKVERNLPERRVNSIDILRTQETDEPFGKLEWKPRSPSAKERKWQQDELNRNFATSTRPGPSLGSSRVRLFSVHIPIPPNLASFLQS